MPRPADDMPLFGQWPDISPHLKDKVGQRAHREFIDMQDGKVEAWAGASCNGSKSVRGASIDSQPSERVCLKKWGIPTPHPA
ncbi:MAG: hypothetical protein ACRD4I_16775, partial [Candidatus Angelobacter sp.]